MNRRQIDRDARDRCPGILAFHRAEDGGLARIRLPGGRISPRQLEAVAAAAKIGSGLIELSSRANLQVRGLPATAASEVARLLSATGLLPSPAHDHARNILASPIAGRHPGALAATDDLVRELDAGLCEDSTLATLSGRFLFAVDDGTGLALGNEADLALVAMPAGHEVSALPSARRGALRSSPTFALNVAGTPTTARVASREAASLALRAARAFLQVRAEHGGDAWRVREIRGGTELVARRVGARSQPAALVRATAMRGWAYTQPGVRAQNDGRAAVTALAPLGRLDRETVIALAKLVSAYGKDVRLSPSRTLTVVDVAAERAEALARDLEASGLLVASDSGWAEISTCAGFGFCRNARVDVRFAAERRAAARAEGAPREHWSACERRCGETPGVAIAVAADSDGLAVRTAEGESRTSTSAEAIALLAARVAGP